GSLIPQREDPFGIIDEAREARERHVQAATRIAIAHADARVCLEILGEAAVAAREEPQHSVFVELLRYERTAGRHIAPIGRGNHGDRQLADPRSHPQRRLALRTRILHSAPDASSFSRRRIIGAHRLPSPRTASASPRLSATIWAALSRALASATARM